MACLHLGNRARRLTSVALAGSVLLLSTPSLAGAGRAAVRASTSADVVARENAKQRYRDGVEAYEAGLYELSIAYFEQADRLVPSAALAFNIARAYEKLGRPADALEKYREYLRRAPDSPNAPLARSHVARLEAAEDGKSDASGARREKPAGAERQLDSEEIERTAGHEPAGSVEHAAPAEPAGASLAFAAAAPAPARFDESDGLGAWPWVALGAGGVSLLGAGVFEWLRSDAESDAREARRDPQQSQVDHAERLETVESRRSAAQLSLGVGAALLVTGGVLLLVDDRMSRPSTTTAGVSVGPGGVSASMTTRF